jgi:ABC-type oligopeptide transport system substrate-binding subunit
MAAPQGATAPLDDGAGADATRRFDVDPEWFVDLFRHGDGWCSGWNTTSIMKHWPNHARSRSGSRMARLAACERILLRAMPIIPLCHDVQPRLIKPYLKGVASNLLIREQFKCAWIDTNRRVS